MERLLVEQMEANKKLPKNIKFNKAFDVAKDCAEFLKNSGAEQFQTYLKCFKSFSTMLRDGLPLKVVDFLINPSDYDLVELSPSTTPGPTVSTSSQLSPSATSATSISSQLSPTSHIAFLEPIIPFRLECDSETR